jgi:hypothetical protein
MDSPAGTPSEPTGGGAAVARSRGGWWKLLLVLVLAWLVIWAIADVINWAEYPWKFPLLSTLTGDWNGELRLTANDRRYVHLHLAGPANFLSFPGDTNEPITGDALICNSKGSVQDYRVSGDTRNWRGSHFWINLGVGNRRPPGPLLEPYTIEGRWRGDVLNLRDKPQVNRIEPNGSISYGTSITRQLPQITWQMRRGSRAEFTRGCQQLR